MKETFNEFYAKIYDDLYSQKPYADEVEYIIKLISNSSTSASYPSHVLDFGCGTGNHSLEFYKRGFFVTGLDPSPFMIEIARTKITRVPELKFLVGGIDTVILENYNLVTCLFNVLGYYSAESNPAQLFKKFNTLLLKDNGRIVVDFWDVSKIHHDAQEKISKSYITKWGLLQRTTSSKFVKNDVLEIYINWNIDGLPINDSQEKHMIKVFSSIKIMNLLKQAGFKNIEPLEIPKGLYIDPRSSGFTATAGD